MSYTTSAHINLKALTHNFERVRTLAKSSRVIAMVKANAYGHGLTLIAQALKNADALGVARLEEALQLRQAGISQPIVLMEGFFEAAELTQIAQHQLSIVIHQMEQVNMLMEASLTTPISVWLKLDSGMHRLGLQPNEFLLAREKLKKSPNVASDLILTTHFACADELNNSYTAQQIHLFNEVTAGLPDLRSLANSAAILTKPSTHQEWVRPGIMLYGISPFAEKTGIELGLQPVMTLRSTLLSIQLCQKGDAIGYGGTFICPETMPIGLISTGYGDGYPRHIPRTGTPVLINGQLTQILARVSMDMIYVDLRPITQPRLGDTVTLWGEGLPIEQIAALAKTNAYELACGITSRVERIAI